MIFNVIDHCDIQVLFDKMGKEEFDNLDPIKRFKESVQEVIYQSNSYDHRSLEKIFNENNLKINIGEEECNDKITSYIKFNFMYNAPKKKPYKVGGLIYFMKEKEYNNPIFVIQTPHVINHFPDIFLTSDYGWVGYDDLDELVQAIEEHISRYVIRYDL